MTGLIKRLDTIEFRKLIWLLAITETIHNLEEAVWLPAWSATAGVWHPPVGVFEFRFAVTIVTMICYGVIYLYYRSGNKLMTYILAGTLALILINIIIPHMAATLSLRQYVPGVISGLLLNAPVTLYLLRRGFREGIFSTRMLLFGTLGFAIVMVPLLPVLMRAGKFIGGML